MLYSNRNYGWARLLFQAKCRPLRRTGDPQTPETARRLKEAEKSIAECDLRIAG